MYYCLYSIQTFQSVRHIAELLINLQQSGNVKYTGWILKIPCSKDNSIIGILRNQIKKMQIEFTRWKNMVDSARKKFYELNYFTTIQLLVLRKELSVVESPLISVPPRVLSLLHSISREVNPRGVRELVKDVLSPTASNPFSQGLMTQASDEDRHHPKGVVSAVEDTSDDVSQLDGKPKITENDLDANKREILDYVIRKINCSKKLVLMAFEEFQGQDKHRSEYLTWCNENIDECSDYPSGSEEGTDEEDDENIDREDLEVEPTELMPEDSEFVEGTVDKYRKVLLVYPRSYVVFSVM